MYWFAQKIHITTLETTAGRSHIGHSLVVMVNVARTLEHASLQPWLKIDKGFVETYLQGR
jgi:hypothetical protein